MWSGSKDATMGKRTPIPPSIRWSVFYRDGFACRYCGAQAGQDGVELEADHVLSVKEGGDNRIDNLVTACRVCNVGKGPKSLLDVPTSEQVKDRIEQTRAGLAATRQTIRDAIAAEKDLSQEMVNLKCAAYRVRSVRFAKGEETIMRRLVAEFGADKVLEWYTMAKDRRVSEWKAVQYVCGIARKVRTEAEGVF